MYIYISIICSWKILMWIIIYAHSDYYVIKQKGHQILPRSCRTQKDYVYIIGLGDSVFQPWYRTAIGQLGHAYRCAATACVSVRWPPTHPYTYTYTHTTQVYYQVCLTRCAGPLSHSPLGRCSMNTYCPVPSPWTLFDMYKGSVINQHWSVYIYYWNMYI